jgi:uncharacterized protein YjbI with pentapeptide repeats
MTSFTSTGVAGESFLCGCGELMRPACAGLPFYKEYEGAPYCVLHYPGVGKSVEFGEALTGKLEVGDYDFRGVSFPEAARFSNFLFRGDAVFSGARFGAEANFDGAVFSGGATFDRTAFAGEANFSAVTFEGSTLRVSFFGATFGAGTYFGRARFSVSAEFGEAMFSGRTNFSHAVFSGAVNFSLATFGGRAVFEGAAFNGGAYFRQTIFSGGSAFGGAGFREEATFPEATFTAEAYFGGVTFGGGANFYRAAFGDYARFSAEQIAVGPSSDRSSMDFRYATIDKPERFSFHTIRLRPHWFVNVDARKFEFTNSDWNWSNLRIQAEVDALARRGVSAPYRLLSVACRHLADNAGDSHRYEEASRFRYWSMNARRKEKWRGFALWRLEWWYWAASGYGERSLQALLVLLGIWMAFALLYTRVGFVERWGLADTLFYSLDVMLLQRPEPRAVTVVAKSLVKLETVLGPVQAALFALAVRRKFMR